MPKNFNFLSNHLSDDLLFLIACCQTDPSKDDINFMHSYLNAEQFNINNLIGLANQHGIVPLLYKSIKNIPTSNYSLPTTTLSELKAHYMSISQRNMLMSAELIRITKLLKKNDIEALAFKGPTLSQMAYGDITLRQFGDLDILIRKKDRSKMMDLMIKEHYIPEIDLKENTKETFFNSVNVIAFYNESTGIRTEVHWELLSKNYAIDWEEESLWMKHDSIQINQKKIPILALEQLLLYLSAHGAKHLFERLEWVCDIDRSVRANPDIDWQRLLNEAKRLGITRMLYLGLALSKLLFHLKLPVQIEKNIEQDQKVKKLISQVIEINFSESSKEGKNYSTFGLLWSMRENLSDQLHFAWRGLFAPKFDDFLFLQLPKRLAFLYPLVRPYRLILKYLPLRRSNT